MSLVKLKIKKSEYNLDWPDPITHPPTPLSIFVFKTCWTSTDKNKKSKMIVLGLEPTTHSRVFREVFNLTKPLTTLSLF